MRRWESPGGGWWWWSDNSVNVLNGLDDKSYVYFTTIREVFKNWANSLVSPHLLRAAPHADPPPLSVPTAWDACYHCWARVEASSSPSSQFTAAFTPCHTLEFHYSAENSICPENPRALPSHPPPPSHGSFYCLHCLAFSGHTGCRLTSFHLIMRIYDSSLSLLARPFISFEGLPLLF